MNFDSNYAKPILTEPGVKYFLNETLKQCHSFKEKYNNMMFNIGITFAFFIIFGLYFIQNEHVVMQPDCLGMYSFLHFLSNECSSGQF